MVLDRNIQLKILRILATCYPDFPESSVWHEIESYSDNQKTVLANLRYLEGHGLISSGLSRTIDGKYTINCGALFITEDGLDFLADDGGLGAILKTVTVKIHDDSLKKIEDFIQNSSLGPEDKPGFVARLRELPADATKHLFLKLLDLGLENMPGALQLIQKSLFG